ncbi:uncharacterized protein F4812DRAFT_147887 [Daldinia caldariorum]|uniref:uncharacterized protein n=1 Tax=Daldinia caldariorum TaxID=326644 RepID=UPI0020085205|nr:uncharacterized protein F4812DRAFT_147887 [Daldinia caldariorum]KAI1465010.1 hypothetical protein F4812DRAFT_147887 [Daldinia caldariorum]
MAAVLGKRKSRAQKPEPSVSQEEAQAIFRRHFEAQFEPLQPSSHAVSKPAQAADEPEDLRSDSDSDDDDDAASEDSWDGVSDSESESSPPGSSAVEVVEVVTHTSKLPPLSADPLAKRESKAYLSSRVPSSSLDPSASLSSSSAQAAANRKAAAEEDAPSLLKNDLALQRLLSESHLLAGRGHDGSIEHAGRNRHLATDLRLAALGSKASIFAQAKMPMSHRKGIVAAAAARESKRRREARENGIILERPAGGVGAGAKGGKPTMRKRERAVDAPAVGRLRNGMLKLSSKDIAEIQGSDRRSRGASGGKRRRR